MRIFLIGFMGSGKSYIGKNIAKQLNLPFVDLDELIEKKEGKMIRKIFEEQGEDYFRKIEKQYLHELSSFENAIIATGGGTPCFFDNIEFLNQNGVTIFLETSVDLLFKRLKSEMDTRPLLQDFSSKELRFFIEKNLNDRLPFYHQAQLVYEQETGMEDAVNELIRYLMRFG